ncbi:CBS domain-containing protein [Endozoicomonas euniceicola]|uniref:CBS domain-containing protein n=1 Tax=Endozoicomonas euniceicola TaxID=1234143 RepID=A0ABY6GXK6_9GAMM|nr:CBS domain-containing protein [Endozoicomonas euniceicola]UYM17400.1 CBS domain-containing protein [Endozoicomonas euniceicola]
MKVVKDIVRRNITPLPTELYLAEAVERILASGLTGLPVIDDDGKLVGFLSEQDCIAQMLSGTYHSDNRKVVADLMHGEPLFVTPEESVIDVAQRMQINKPKVYPVIQDDELLGVISRQDVLKALSEMIKSVSFA